MYVIYVKMYMKLLIYFFNKVIIINILKCSKKVAYIRVLSHFHPISSIDRIGKYPKKNLDKCTPSEVQVKEKKSV